MDMHPALGRLIEANAEFDRARASLAAAEERRRQCALGLAAIEDEDARWDAAVSAYRKFGKGLSVQLAEAATGLPGKRGQSALLERAGARKRQPKGRDPNVAHVPRGPTTEWPELDALEREVVRSHIKHGKPYWIRRGLGWTAFNVKLEPAEAGAFLDDPSAALGGAFGISRDAFVEWLSTEGFVRCEGRTVSAARCRCGVHGLGSQLSIERWIEAKARGGYCSQHG